MIHRVIRYILSPFITYFKYIGLILRYKNVTRIYHELDENTLIDLIKKTRIKISYGNNILLNLSIRNNKMILLKFLLANKRLNTKRINEIPMLLLAINYNNIEGLRLLLEDGRIDPTHNKSNALRCACCGGETGMVKLLLDDGRSDPSAKNQEAIRWAASNGHIEIIKMLMECPGVDPMHRHILLYRSAFSNAYRRGFTKIVEMFLKDHRVDPTVDDNQMLSIACKVGFIGIVKLLVDHPLVDFSVDANKFIFYAAVHGNVDIGKILIRDRKVLSKLDENGIEYLHSKGILPLYSSRKIDR